MSVPDLIIFDCDGVLIDSELIYSQVDAEVFTALGFPLSLEEVFERFVGRPVDEMLREIEAQFARALPDDIEDRLRSVTHQRLADELTALPHLDSVLPALPASRCIASSTSPDGLRYSLGLVGLYDRFAPHIFSATMVANGKPAPDLFLHAAAEMGAARERCLVIEDSVPGVTAGRAAGMRVLGFTGGAHCGPGHGEKLRRSGAEAIFDDMRALPALAGF